VESIGFWLSWRKEMILSRSESFDGDRAVLLQWRRWLGSLLSERADGKSMLALARACRKMYKDLPNWPLCFMNAFLADEPPSKLVVIGRQQALFERISYRSLQRLRLSHCQLHDSQLHGKLRVLSL